MFFYAIPGITVIILIGKNITAHMFLKVKSAQCCNRGFTCCQSRWALGWTWSEIAHTPSILTLLEVTPFVKLVGRYEPLLDKWASRSRL